MLPILPAAQSIQLTLDADSKWHKCEIFILDEDDAESLFKERCRVLIVVWVSELEPSMEYFLAHNSDGHLTFGQHFHRQEWADALNSARKLRPYGYKDIHPEPIGIATAMMPDNTSDSGAFDICCAISDAAKNFLAQIEQDDVLSQLRIERNLTLSERTYLLGNLRRVQAVNFYPFLLALLVTSQSNQDDMLNVLTEVIDAGWELLPALQQVLRVPPHTIRTLQRMPAWLPESHHDACLSELRPDRIARVLAKIPPEKHPDKGNWPGFLYIISWVSRLWRTHGDPKFPKIKRVHVLLPVLGAEAWLSLLRRRHFEIPDPFTHDWLTDMRESIRHTHSLGGKILFGNFDGNNICLHSEVWAVLSVLLCHPSDLRVEGRRWDKRSTIAARGVGSNLSTRRLPVAIKHDICLPGNYRLAPIQKVSDLVAQSIEAQNCLPIYLPDIFSRRCSILSIHAHDGMLLGHAEIRQPVYGGYEIGARRAFQNRDLSQEIELAIDPRLAEICQHLNDSHFSKASDEDKLLSEQSDRDIRKAKALIHADASARIMDKAVRRFQLTSPTSDAQMAFAISRHIDDGDYAQAKNIATRHGAAYRGEFSFKQSHGSWGVTDTLFRHPMPNGGDYPDDIVLLFSRRLASPFHNGGGNTALARQILGSVSLDFSAKLQVIEKFPQLTQLKVDAFTSLYAKESESFKKLARKESGDVAALSAKAILNMLLLSAWYYGLDLDTDQETETAFICSILGKAALRGLNRTINSMSTDWWKDNPLSAYVFRHLLPPSHSAWVIAEMKRASMSNVVSPDIK